MSVQFITLGSGSSGNASLLDADGFGLLIDAGLGPRQIGTRLKAVDASWNNVHAAILTHTHADHWQDATLAQLLKREIRFYCHPMHVGHLVRLSPAFRSMQSAGLVKTYTGNSPIPISDDLVAHPIRVPHDCGATFGFRFECEGSLFSRAWAMAYAADLGSWVGQMVQALADVDVLALEFNHDVGLQRASGRPPHLIARVLGNEGHLSNEQAGTLLGEALQASRPQRLKSVVQLHLSQQCNRVRLARTAAQKSLHAHRNTGAIHTADHQTPMRVPICE